MGIYTRPEITDDRVKQIKDIIANNPSWNRTKISQYICRLWEWESPNGQLKDISCRKMLRRLDRKEIIRLPERQAYSRSKGGADKVRHIEHNTDLIDEKLSALRPLIIIDICGGKELVLFKSFIDQYHYLGFDRSIGENMKYIVYDNNGRPLSCILFGSAAWSCHDRDSYIGWDKYERGQSLRYMTNNSRYLIFPWVKAPHLASHILSLISHRISEDWRKKYGHPVYCLETFVETGRYRGTCYKAANWVNVGTTTGRGRDGGHHSAVLPTKDVYLYPLTEQFRELLIAQERQGNREWA